MPKRKKLRQIAEWAKVYHSDVWGTKERKLGTLDSAEIDFTELNLDPRMAYLVPHDDSGKTAYEKGVSIGELFSAYVSGFFTGNDRASISPTKQEITRRVDVVKSAVDETPILDIWGKFAHGQTAEKIQNDILSDCGVIAPAAFRPFNMRWTFYSGNSSGWMVRPRERKTWDGVFISEAS